MVDWLNKSFSEDLSAWNLNRYTIFNFFIIYKRIFDDLFSINWSSNFLFPNYGSLYDSLLDNRLRNDSFVNDRLSDDGFCYFRLIDYFSGLSNCGS